MKPSRKAPIEYQLPKAPRNQIPEIVGSASDVESSPNCPPVPLEDLAGNEVVRPEPEAEADIETGRDDGCCLVACLRFWR